MGSHYRRRPYTRTRGRTTRIDLSSRHVQSDRDEAALVARARAGDERAFAGLVDRYGDMIIGLAFASTLNSTDAEDLAQDVFISACRGLGRFRGDSAFSTWLISVARNCCVDRARRASVRPSVAAFHDTTRAGSDAAHDRTETAGAIMSAAATLSLPLRQAVLLRDVQGFSYDEIAELQGVPVGTVRSRIASARRTIVAAIGVP